ncbi:MAG: NAD(P)-dependent oxidoreductase [Treponema sp.]|jgi:nucleoside-diphosphate-sugar epimerase|nr:NAD(P)-dependent oxidoreductase [Treponema sp.]
MQKVIITGAGGYVGSRLTRVLIDQGITVYALDCLNNPPVQHNLLHYYQCDIEKNQLPFESNMQNSDVLFHFAWDGAGPRYRNNYEHQLKNISSLINILSFAKHLNISKTIIPGSASEYASSEMPITGNNMPGTIDAYGAVKSSCHIISRTWSIKNNLPLIWVVPSSAYGPGRDDNNVLTYVIKALLKNEKPSFTALEQCWDYIYIDDLIEALILVAKKGLSGKNYAIGFGTARKLQEYITIIRDSINPTLPLGIGEIPYKNNKPDNSEMDISELQNDTGFSPAIVFEEGIKKTIEWYKKTL